MFVFGDFNVHLKDCLTHSGGNDKPGELYHFSDLVNSAIIFLSQMTLFKWLTFVPECLTVTLTALLFWISFFLLMLVFILQWLPFHWEILIMLMSQFPLASQQTQNGMPRFTAYFMTIYVLIWIVCDYLRDVPWEDIS